MTQLAVGYDCTKSDLPVNATSFCRVVFINMAGNSQLEHSQMLCW